MADSIGQTLRVLIERWHAEAAHETRRFRTARGGEYSIHVQRCSVYTKCADELEAVISDAGLPSPDKRAAAKLTLAERDTIDRLAAKWVEQWRPD